MELNDEKIAELKRTLEGMHKPAKVESGAWWRGECPDGCQACIALCILQEAEKPEMVVA